MATGRRERFVKLKLLNGDGHRPDRDECKVTTSGISHLFAPYAVGVRCKCGRKVVVEDDEGGLAIRAA
jgi:hypothetical protein